MAFARLIAAVAAIAVLSGPGQTAEKRGSERDRFQLWNNCEGMGLQIYVRHYAKPSGVHPPDEKTVETAVRSRLRSARLYLGENYSTSLFVSVRTAGYAVALHLRFYKFVNENKQYYPNRRVYPGGWAITYFTLWVGQYGSNGADIMNGVARLMDQFIDEYLRVNAAACQRR